MKEGDKLLCRRTHYIGSKHIWQIGKYYEIEIETGRWSRYRITCEQVDYFITSEKELRKQKLEAICSK
jgi:hypothetical protein